MEGYCIFDNELERKLDDGEIMLGGCSSTAMTGLGDVWSASMNRGGEDNGIEGDDRRPG